MMSQCGDSRTPQRKAAHWRCYCAHLPLTTPLPPPLAGSFALHHLRARMAPARHALSRNLSATAGARSDLGFSNGVTAMRNSSSQRMLSLWLRRLSTDRIAKLRENPRKRSTPLVIAGKRGNTEILTAVDDAAERLALSPGLTLAQARAMHPGIDTVAENIEADAALLESIADGCLRYTPLVACDAPDGLLLDISGCAHLYGGEHELIADLSGSLEKAGFAYSLAIAGTIGAAWAAAHYGKPASHACGEERALLTPMPLSALRLPPATVASLSRVGVKCIGDIIDLPRAPLTARFGSEVLRQLDRALGHEHEPLTPRLPVAPYVAEQRFAEPIAREEDVLAITRRLARQLQFALERRGDGARRIELALFRTDGVVRRIAAGTSRPLRDPDDIRELFVERLAALADAFDPGFGFDMARLSVVIAEPSPPEQIGIGGSEDASELCRLVDRLSARLGPRRVRQIGRA